MPYAYKGVTLTEEEPEGTTPGSTDALGALRRLGEAIETGSEGRKRKRSSLPKRPTKAAQIREVISSMEALRERIMARYYEED